MRPSRLQITVDCHDPARLGVFWAAALGYPPPDVKAWHDFLRHGGTAEEELNATFALEDPQGRFPRMFFQRVPEAKTAKNRMHLDLAAPGEHGDRNRVDVERQRLVGLGATVLGSALGHGGDWVVMADPEGNEFCVD